MTVARYACPPTACEHLWGVHLDGVEWCPLCGLRPCGDCGSPFCSASPGPAEPERLFIRAETVRLAGAAASDLGLPWSPNSPYWRFLGDDYVVRGRARLRVLSGPFAHRHPRATQIGISLHVIECARPGAVEWVTTR